MNARLSLAAACLIAATPFAVQAQTPATYVAKAGASDLFEQTSSKLVLRTTKNAKVRSFATMMVSDHAKSTAMVKAAAAKANVKAPPPQLNADQQSKISALTKASGTARDKLYWDQQKTAHAQALELHQTFARSDGPAPLKDAASKIVPVVQQHIAALNGGGDHHSH